MGSTISPNEVPWVDGLTIAATLEQTVARHGDGEALVFCQTGERLTWRELHQAVTRVAGHLISLGFKPGDRFGIWATNRSAWVILQLATASIGVVAVTVNPAYRAAELAYTVRQAALKGLALSAGFRSTNYFGLLEQARKESVVGEFGKTAWPLECWIQLSGVPQPGMIPWYNLLNAPPLRADITTACTASDPIHLLYTSGTTGYPRGALLTHRNLLLNAYYIAQRQALTDSDRICVPVPLYHCFGCVLGTLCALVSGATLVFPHESFDAGLTLQSLDSERCTAIYGVPTMFLAQLEHPDFAQRDLTSLRTGVMAGSPCPIELMKRVTDVMGVNEITIAYGQTEASPIITMTRTNDSLAHRVGTVGTPLPGIEVEILDPQTGEVLPDLRSGELCCRGHNVMLEYYQLPEATAATVDSEGWLHTGDLAMRQADGYYRITGRIKDMIIRGGENIAPREIEERLFQHPAVEDAQVVGVPDPKYGEEIMAWIKLRREQTATAEQLRAFCREHLAHFKTPKYFKFVDHFPTTVTGKIQKFRLRELALEELGLTSLLPEETA